VVSKLALKPYGQIDRQTVTQAFYFSVKGLKKVEMKYCILYYAAFF
jgi:hypothetical protein